jgi:hypothetical protein
MGLLSSRTFRQVATGALQGIEEKREEMRDRIDVYREKAVKRKDNLQKEYNAYYKEEKTNIDNFKSIATKLGEDYVPMLNSFVGGDSSKLKALDGMDINAARLELDKYKDAVGGTNFITSRQESIGLKKEELDTQLQNQVGLFKGTSSLFTRDIERRGAKDIETEVGTLDTKTIDRKFNAGRGIGIKESLKLSEVMNNNKIYQNYFMDELNDAGEKTNNRIVNPDYAQDVANIDQQVAEMITNGFNGTNTQAIAEVIEMLNNPSYKGPNLSFLTQASDDAPIIAIVQQEFEKNLIDRNVTGMQEDISTLSTVGRESEAEELQKRLDEFLIAEQNLTIEDVVERKKEEQKDYEAPEGKLDSLRTDKPKYNRKYKDVLPFSEWMDLSPEAVREIYDRLRKEERGEEKSGTDKVKEALGL